MKFRERCSFFPAQSGMWVEAEDWLLRVVNPRSIASLKVYVIEPIALTIPS